MYSAQAQLADAYIASGSAAEAKFLAEDLVAREPWERANIERFRRVLVLLGEPDPDGLIADRLSGQVPFMATELSYAGDQAAVDFVEPESFAEQTGDDLAGGATREPGDRADVDLSVVLDDEQPAVVDSGEPESDDVEAVFATLRDSSRSAMAVAEQEYERGMRLYDFGQIDDCVAPLEAASCAPAFRFATGALLGRIFRDRGMLEAAVEWFERAAQAPPPDIDEGHRLLYDLADALESIGEASRALAVCLELQTDAGEYRDVAARVDRLTRLQDGG
jgi:tetratricopeptide (TPR) repeat protein